MTVLNHIDPRSPVPIYAQIAARIRVAVAAGELCPGDALPSVRGLATQLRVNPATVVQAYRELEGEGVVEIRHGSGTYVGALSSDRRSKTRAREARRLVRGVLEEAARLGISADDLRSAMDDELGDDHA